MRSDVLILGGGVIGLTTACYLRKARLSVTVLDQGDLGQESSWAGAGILNAVPRLNPTLTPLERLAAHSGPLIDELSRELLDVAGIDNGLQRAGGIELFEPDQPTSEAIWTRQEISFQTLTPALRATLEPALQVGQRRGFFVPATGQLRNPRHLKALLGWCALNQVELRPHCPVLGFEVQAGRLLGVRTPQGLVSAGQYVLTAGAWAGGLLASLGVSCPVKPVRGQIVLLRTPPRFLTRVIEVGRRYIVPRPDGRVLIGSTEEDAGFEKKTTAGAIAGLIEFACTLVPGLAEMPLERCWSGLRPGSPDGLPFIGPVPGVEQLWVAAGHFRAGIQLSTGTGYLLRQMILGEPAIVPPQAFRLDRPIAGPGT